MAAPKTLDDIAAQCGVSASTVSRVLNNEPGISSVTRERVMAVAKKHNFSLQRRRRQAGRASVHLTVAIPGEEEIRGNPFYEMADIVHAMNNVFKEKKTIEVVTFPSLEEELRGSSFFTDGIILAFGDLGEGARGMLRSRGIPRVFLNRTPEGENYVSCNHVKGMVRLHRHLAEDGHRRIGYLGYRGHPVDRDRHRGYMIGEIEHSGGFGEDRVLSVEGVDLVTAETARFFLDRQCDAVMCFNDNFAIRLIQQLELLGAPVPGRISVTGFDNSPMRKLFRPAVTTINLSTFEMAFLAARWIQDNIVNRSSRILHCEVEGDLLTGGTVATRGVRA
ncbi:MAG: LacI family DNA-binding transcriptional regulator [Spirochaetes bacterium]|nr:LacI family DNA-binding transcriptional regulator [Spirochaetota bacterium]